MKPYFYKRPVLIILFINIKQNIQIRLNDTIKQAATNSLPETGRIDKQGLNLQFVGWLMIADKSTDITTVAVTKTLSSIAGGYFAASSEWKKSKSAAVRKWRVAFTALSQTRTIAGKSDFTAFLIIRPDFPML